MITLVSHIKDNLDTSLISVVRMGGVETSSILEYLQNGLVSRKNKKKLSFNAGFYDDKNSFEEFISLNRNALQDATAVAEWGLAQQDILLDLFCATNLRFKLKDLEPFHDKNDWISFFNFKSIAVVTSFPKTFGSQLKNISYVHPKLELDKIRFEFIQAPVTNLGAIFDNSISWFDRLYDLEKKIHNDYDLVLISAGSYGVPLSGLLSARKINNIVMGGALQLVFGVTGKRWLDRDDYKNLFNQYWISPLSEETPLNKHKLENGCYW